MFARIFNWRELVQCIYCIRVMQSTDNLIEDLSMQKQLNINDLAVQRFADSVEDLIQERKDWEQNAFKSANDYLYDLLTQIYRIYDETCTCDESGKAKRE